MSGDGDKQQRKRKQTHYSNYKQMRCQPGTRAGVEIRLADYAGAAEEAVDTSSQARNFRALSP
jgi:hypothetical protein